MGKTKAKHGRRRRQRTANQRENALSHRGPRKIVNYRGAYYMEDEKAYIGVEAPMILSELEEEIADVHPLELLELSWEHMCKAMGMLRKEKYPHLRMVEVQVPCTITQLRHNLLLPSDGDDLQNDTIGVQWPVRLATVPVRYIERTSHRVLPRLVATNAPLVIPQPAEGAKLRELEHWWPEDGQSH